MNHHVLIAEDHPLIRQGLRALLATDPVYVIVDEACDGREAVVKTLRAQPDLVLMDLTLPGIGGVEAAAQIRRRLPQQKILALGEHESELHAGEAVRAGCVGFVHKGCPPEELLLAVRTVLVGRRFLSQDLANMLMDGMLHPGRGRGESAMLETLSRRERTIFKLIAEGRTNRSAADYLNLSAKTVEKHRASLMRKLKLGSAVELTLLAVDLGIIQRPTMRLREPVALEPQMAG